MLHLLGFTLLSAMAGMTAMAQDNMGTPSACPVGAYLVPGTTRCVDRCPSPLLGYKGACVQMCPAGLLIEPMTATCVSTCPAGSFPTSSGACTQGPMCPPDKIPYNGMCVSMDYMCQVKIPGSVFNGQECVCPVGAWMNRNRNTTSTMVESVCAPAANATGSAATGSSPPPPINCESYIANTVYNWQYQECQCSPRYPVIVRNPADPALPFGCAMPGTASDIRPCLLPMYFSFQEGQCMNVTMQSPAPTPSASTSPSSKPSQRPAEPSASPSPTAKPTQRTIQEPSASETMTAKPTQRTIQEPSASETMTAKPTQRSDGGGSTDADISQTPRPMESMKPSERPAETMKPSERPAESMKPTQKPSERPAESMKPTQKPSEPTQKPSPSAFPTRRPDAMWAVDVTRKPLPSRPPMPSFSQRPLLQSAKPTPWRPRDPLPSDMPRPPYIQSSVKFPAANATKMQQPDVIQELQASLACTLNLPLDNIRIQNITVRRDGAAPQVIDVSTFPQLRSNGSGGCFRPMANAPAVAATRRLRALQQQQQSSSVDVDYYIVDPTDDILALSTAEFSTVLSNSAPMSEIAASVGSSGVTAVATEPTAAGPGSSAAATTTNASGIQVGSLVGGVVGGIALCVAAFTAYKLATRNRRSGAVRLQGTSVAQSRVILVDNTNPLQVHASNNSMRLVGYAPTQARASV